MFLKQEPESNFLMCCYAFKLFLQKKKKIELKSVVGNVLLVVKPKQPDETSLRCVISEVFH